jgi:nitrite reductase/ring-hydroxylating ferredoxin subunit
MLVYVAYALLIAHVSLGALQSETNPVLAAVLGVGLAAVLSLHLAAAFTERRIDQFKLQAAQDGFVNVCAVDSIEENRAAVVSVMGERVAIFRYDGRISALSNVCRHQNGPLGEGKIIDGCVTCPWHGYQYVPDTGASPPPFRKKFLPSVHELWTVGFGLIQNQMLQVRPSNPAMFQFDRRPRHERVFCWVSAKNTCGHCEDHPACDCRAVAGCRVLGDRVGKVANAICILSLRIRTSARL